MVFFVTARYLKDKAEIEDVVQETFVQFFGHASAVGTSVRSYLTASVKNLALNAITKKLFIGMKGDFMMRIIGPKTQNLQTTGLRR